MCDKARAKFRCLFDHLVSASEQRRRNVAAERSGGFEVFPPHLCVVGQSDLMMHYDITVNDDDCEIRLSGDQTFFVAHIFRRMLSKFPNIRVET